MELLFIGIGGAFGSVARYEIGRIIAKRASEHFPLGTFIVNISGAILLGAVTAVNPGGNAYLLLADGFLGAYTTFSTFMYEGFHLFRGSKAKNAVMYIGITLVLGVIGYIAGYELSRIFIM